MWVWELASEVGSGRRCTNGQWMSGATLGSPHSVNSGVRSAVDER